MVAGVAPFALGEAKPRDVLRRAHSAAQDARRMETRVSVYSSTEDAAHQRRFSLLNDFSAALTSRDQLRLVYQPRIDIGSRACGGAEALLRWRHPSLGDISPGEFMPIIEQTSKAREATAWVLGTVLKQIAAWRGAGLDLKISMNVSASNLLEPDFAGRVVESLVEHSLEASCLEIEITETAVMEHAGPALSALETLAGAGVRLAIDDFGTGYSSLSYLQRLPTKVVKIDQSFVRDLAEDERARSLVSAMIALSHDLGYRVVAEGVETKQILDIIEGLSCDEAQGYLIGRPMAPENFTSWCREGPYAPRAEPGTGPL